MRFLFYVLFAISAFDTAVVAKAQAPEQVYVNQLNRFQGYKLFLLGDWNNSERNAWNEILNAEGIFEFSFQIVGREWLTGPFSISKDEGDNKKAIDGFELWLRQLSNTNARWVMLNLSNQPIASGRQLPTAKSLLEMLNAAGMKSPLKILREFLMVNPEHLEARADLLKEVRRRALKIVPAALNATLGEDLGAEADLRTWQILAFEAEKAFALNWIGLDLDFFAPEKSQPEAFSPIMRAFFKKHISRVESALQEWPTNRSLWNIWAWMARSLKDHPIDRFVEGLEALVLPGGQTEYNSQLCPSDEVAAWLVQEARNKKDWEKVIRYGQNSKRLRFRLFEQKFEWRVQSYTNNILMVAIEGYPQISSYYPMLEAYLKTGRTQEASQLFNEMILQYNRDRYRRPAAAIAREAGFEQLAEIWESSESLKIPFYRSEAMFGSVLLAAVNTSGNRPALLELEELASQLKPQIKVDRLNPIFKDTLLWTDDDFRWALVNSNGFVVAQDKGIPTIDRLQRELDNLNIESDIDIARRFVREHPNHYQGLFTLALEVIRDSLVKAKSDSGMTNSNSSRDEELWGEAHRLWSALLQRPDAIWAYPNTTHGIDLKAEEQKDSMMKPLSYRYLSNIEAALAYQPNSRMLWNQWLFWRAMGGNERDLEPVIDNIEQSPMNKPSMWPPAYVMSLYYNELKREGRWFKIVDMLKLLWEKGLALENLSDAPGFGEKRLLNDPNLGDRVGVPLFEALVKENKYIDALELCNIWHTLGGRFSNPQQLIGFANDNDAAGIANELTKLFESLRK